MPEIETINIRHSKTTLNSDTGILWWNKSYPFRVDVDLTVRHNPLPVGQVLSVKLPYAWVTSGKIKSDLSNIRVVTRTLGPWQLAPMRVEAHDEDVVVEFQAVNEILYKDSYQIYYGSFENVDELPDEGFVNERFAGSTNFGSKYTSMTNPTEDWMPIENTIESLKVGARAYVDLYVESIRIKGTKGPDGGMIHVYSDGSLLDKVDLYNSFVANDVVLYSYGMPYPGRASLMVEVLPEKNTSSTDYKVRLESVEYDTFTEVTMSDEKIYPKVSWITSTGAS